MMNMVKAKKDLKTKPFSIWLTAEQQKRIEELAKRKGLAPRTWARVKLVEALEKEESDS